MGTTHSHASAEREWKGPFSDKEYECLVAQYKSIAAAGCAAAVQEKVQTLLSLPCSDDVPGEWREPLATLGTSFYEICMHARELNGSEETSSSLKLVDFVQGVAQCTRGSSQSITRAFVRVFMKDKQGGTMEAARLHAMIQACLLMADEGVATTEPKELVHVTKQLASAALPADTAGISAAEITLDELFRWINAQAPLLYTVFTSWVSRRLLGKAARLSYYPPALSHKSDVLSQSQSIALSFTCTPLQKGVGRLYTSTQDGLSFNRLCHHILGYGGPTLVVMRNTDGDIFGMYCDTEWRETTKFYGSNGCFLFRLDPQFSIYRVSANEKANYMYLNTKGVALPRGIGMGGDVNGLRLFLNEDFDENCYTAAKCLSFEPGRLSTRNQFSVEALEVWGCGSDDSIMRQREYRKDAADMINKMRKVDKAAFANNEFDRGFFLGKTFGHGTDQARVVEDEH